MDVPTRTSYGMAVATPAERTAAASLTAVPRSLASSISPVFAGALLTLPFSGLPLVFCGSPEIITTRRCLTLSGTSAAPSDPAYSCAPFVCVNSSMM